MFDVHIVWKRWLFVIRKNLWDNLNLFKFVGIFVFVSIMTRLFVVNILNLFWILWQVGIKSLVLY